MFTLKLFKGGEYMPRKKKNIFEKTVEAGKKGGEAVVNKVEEITETKNKRGRKKKK